MGRRLAAAALGAAATGALLALATRAPPPFHLVALAALVPWLLAADRAASAGEALLGGVALAAGYTLGALGWFASSVAAYTGAPEAVAAALLALASPLLQPQALAAALLRHLARRGDRPLRGAVAFALGWAGVEWAAPKLLGDTLAYALAPSPWLRQAAAVGGAGLVTALALAANEALAAAAGRALTARPGAGDAAEAPRPRGSALRATLAAAALLAAWTGAGALRGAASARPTAGPPLRAGVVQSDLTRYDTLAAERGTYAVVREVLDVHEALSRELAAAGAELLVWPETVYPTTFGAPRSAEGAELDAEIEAFAATLRVPLAFGAYAAEGGREYNAVFFLAPGAPRARYRKAHLFPLTERVPALLDRPAARRLLPWMGTWSAGPGPEVVTLPLRGRTVAVGPLLCYDAVRPEHARAEARAGAALLLALSNDAWFEGGPGPRLHLAAAAFRAVETGLPLLRATPSGISAAVDAGGAVVAEAPAGRATLLADVRPRAGPPSPWLGVQAAFGPAALGVAVLLAAAGWRRR